MLLSALMALALAAPVTVYVGPPTQSGFVDVDKNVWDTVRDIRGALEKRLEKARCNEGSKLATFPWTATCKAESFRILTNEAGADVRLYVLARGEGIPRYAGTLNLPGTTTYSGSTTTTTRIGGQTWRNYSPQTVTTTPGVSIPMTTNSKYIQTVLVVGSYERPFVVEREAGWKKCAGSVAEDVSAWLVTNHGRLAK